MAERTLTIKMKGSIEEINAYCSRVGSVANDYLLEVDFT